MMAELRLRPRKLVWVVELEHGRQYLKHGHMIEYNKAALNETVEMETAELTEMLWQCTHYTSLSDP